MFKGPWDRMSRTRGLLFLVGVVMASATNMERQKRNQYPEAWHNPASAPGVLFIEPRESGELAKNVFTELMDMRDVYRGGMELRGYGVVWTWKAPVDETAPKPYLRLVKD